MRGPEAPPPPPMSPIKISSPRPKPSARRLKVKQLAKKIPIRHVLLLGSLGSPPVSEDGIAIIRSQVQRPCELVGTNSKPWQPGMLLQWLGKMRESRSPPPRTDCKCRHLPHSRTRTTKNF